MSPPRRAPIIVVAATFPPHMGGVEEVARDTARLLARDRDVTVVTTTVGAGTAPRFEHDGGVGIHRHMGCVIAHTPVSPGLVAHLARLPKGTTLHVHVAPVFVPEMSAIVARVRRHRLVMHFHLDVQPSGPLGRVLGAYKSLALGPALRFADRVIVLSDDQRDLVCARYRVDRARVRVVPNGVSVERLCLDAPARDPWPDAPTGLRVLSVGRLAVQKRPERLVEAVASLTQPVVLALVGEGDERGRVEELIARHGVGDRIRLVGTQRGRDLGDWYRWAEVFAMSSDQEGLSIAMLEAMSVGLPIVATDVPGLRDHVGGIGLLGSPTPEGVAGALTQMMDEATRARCAEASAREGATAAWSRRIEPLARVLDGED